MAAQAAARVAAQSSALTQEADRAVLAAQKADRYPSSAAQRVVVRAAALRAASLATATSASVAFPRPHKNVIRTASRLLGSCIYCTTVCAESAARIASLRS